MGRERETRRWSGAATAVGLAALLVLSGTARAAEEAPYDATLARLASTLGALHHLRPLCGAAEAQTWRDQMAALLEAEQPGRERRRRLIERFNHSYRSFAAAHRHCTPAARELAERYRLDGEALGREMLQKWGGS